jgi:hypothetical protein
MQQFSPAMHAGCLMERVKEKRACRGIETLMMSTLLLKMCTGYMPYFFLLSFFLCNFNLPIP